MPVRNRTDDMFTETHFLHQMKNWERHPTYMSYCMSCICGILKMISVHWTASVQSFNDLSCDELRVKRNSPRINTFQQENRGKERNWFGRRRMWFGAQNFATSSLPLPLPSSLSHLFIFDSSLSLFIFALSLSIHLPLLQALIYDCMQCASFSEIGWICMSCCAIIRAWP